MDWAWVDELLEKLGPRYKAGDLSGDSIELRYRFGKAEFRPTRVLVGGGPAHRTIELGVDFRVPRDRTVEETQPLIEVLEKSTLAPRGFSRAEDHTSAMETESGKSSGYVRSLKYKTEATGAEEAAKRIRAIVESIDIPLVLGIHEAKDLVAREPLPEPKKRSAPIEPLETWEYTLSGGLFGSINLVIDPNVRTLKVVERKMLSTQEKEPIKLAHVARFLVKSTPTGLELWAKKRDGEEQHLVTAPSTPDALATAERMAQKVMIPIERAAEKT